jgi:hypothetical protein
MKWFIHQDGETRALLREHLVEGIARGTVRSDDLVWTSGMRRWRSVSEVFGPRPNKFSKHRLEENIHGTSFHILGAVVGVALLSCASLFVHFQKLWFVDVLTTIASLEVGPAIGLCVLLLTMSTILSALVAAYIWAHPARRNASALIGIAFIFTTAAAIIQAANAVSSAVAARDDYAILLALATYGDAELTMVSEHTVYIDGPIGPNLMRDFADYQSIYGRISAIEITSTGGIIDQALQLARYAEDEGLTIVVRDVCFSACTLIAVSTRESYADEAAVFGFHRVSDVAETSSEIAEFGVLYTGEEARSYLADHGVPESVLVAAERHGDDSLLYVTAWEMVDYGAIRGVLSSNNEVLHIGAKL